MSGLTPARLASRAIRDTWRSLAIIALIAAVVAAIGVAGPLVANDVLQQDLNYRLSTAGPGIRDLQSSSDAGYTFGVPSHMDATIASLPAALARIRAKMPEALRSIAGVGRYVARDAGAKGAGIPGSAPPNPPEPASYSYIVEGNPQIQSDAVLVSGKWPAPATGMFQKAPIQVVATVDMAKALTWKIGEVRQLSEYTYMVQGDTQPVELVGTIRPRDANSDYWQLDASRDHMIRHTAADGGNVTKLGTVFMDAGSWTKVDLEFAGPVVETWYPMSSSNLTVAQISSLGGDIQQFVSAPHSVGQGDSILQLQYVTSLNQTIATYTARAGAGNAVISVLEAGPIGTGVALLLLAVLSLVERRRTALGLLRSRGASRAQSRLEVGAQIAAATVPGAIVGSVLAVLVAASTFTALTAVIAVLVAVLPPVVAMTAAVGTPSVLTRGGVARPSRWRWVTDALLVLLAALAVVVLLQRGISGSATGLTTDPLLVVTPLLVSGAICALVLRVVPFALRRLGRAFRRSRGVIGLVGRANSARAGARFLPVFAILTGVSVSIFASSLLATEQSGIHDAALVQVGADINVTAAQIPSATVAKMRRLPGVQELAAINAPGGINLENDPQNTSLFATDGRTLASIESVLPQKYQLFSELGTKRNGVAIAYAGGFTQKPSKVSRFSDSKAAPVAIVEVSADPPKFIQNPPWLLVDTSSVPKDAHLTTYILSVLIRVAPGTDQTVLERQLVGLAGSDATVQVADDQVRQLNGAPLVGGLEALTVAAIILSLVLCVLSLLLTLIINSRERAVVLGRLRALGFSPRQGTGLVAWEIGPMTILGVVAGVLAGVGLPILFLTVVDLSTFIGSDSPPPLVLNASFIAIVVVAFAACAALAVVLAVRLNARTNRVEMLRESGE